VAISRTKLKKKTQPDDLSVVAASLILQAPVLSTVFEISRWSIHC